jgi:hypothetical protein
VSEHRHLPEVVRHPSVVRAAVSPSAVALAAGGVAIGLGAAHSVVLAVVLGLLGWSARMAAAVASRARKTKQAKLKPAQLDPWSVPEPWRQLVKQALAAQTRFDQAVAEWPPGPMRDRLESLRPQLYEDVEQVGLAARRGAALSGWSPAGSAVSGRPSAAELSDQLRRTEAELSAAGGATSERQAALARREEALAAQLRAVHSAEQATALTHDRLQLIVARLDEAVTSMLLLGVEATGAGATDTLAASLDSVMDEITALHQGLADATGSTPGQVESAPALPPTQPPPPAPTP